MKEPKKKPETLWMGFDYQKPKVRMAYGGGNITMKELDVLMSFDEQPTQRSYRVSPHGVKISLVKKGYITLVDETLTLTEAGRKVIDHKLSI